MKYLKSYTERINESIYKSPEYKDVWNHLRRLAFDSDGKILHPHNFSSQIERNLDYVKSSITLKYDHDRANPIKGKTNVSLVFLFKEGEANQEDALADVFDELFTVETVTGSI